MANPVMLQQLPVEELESVAAQYPYFSAVQMLLARAYRDRNDHRFSGKLHQAAAFSGNRKQLFDLLRTPAVPHKSNTPSSSPVKTEKETTLVEPLIPAIPVISDRKGLAQLADVIMDDEVLESIPGSKISPVSASIQPPTEVQQPLEQVAPLDPLSREILIEAVESSIELEVAADKELESQVNEHVTVSGPSVRTPEPITAVSEETEPGSYSQWIYRRSRQLHYSDPGEQILETPEDTTKEDSIELDLPAGEIASPGTISHGSRRIEPADKTIHQWELLDQFIRNEPRITPGKAADYAVSDLAKESLEEDFSLVTETMARMYLAQGKPDKARKAYRKLMELHPEKSIYFAAQLKNLDKNKKA